MLMPLPILRLCCIKLRCVTMIQWQSITPVCQPPFKFWTKRAKSSKRSVWRLSLSETNTLDLISWWTTKERLCKATLTRSSTGSGNHGGIGEIVQSLVSQVSEHLTTSSCPNSQLSVNIYKKKSVWYCLQETKAQARKSWNGCVLPLSMVAWTARERVQEKNHALVKMTGFSGVILI